MESIDYDTLLFLRKEHPGWRLLCSDHAPLIAAFLHRVFLRQNQRTIAEPDLAEALEDDLFTLRERFGADAFPRGARDYLDDWASPAKAWLRKFYPRDSDTPHFDLSPATERAIAWLGELKARPFVGTESRLLTLFDLLRQMVTGSTADPETRIRELEKQREAIDDEIARITGGQLSLLNDTAMRERFQQFTQMARELARRDPREAKRD